MQLIFIFQVILQIQFQGGIEVSISTPENASTVLFTKSSGWTTYAVDITAYSGQYATFSIRAIGPLLINSARLYSHSNAPGCPSYFLSREYLSYVEFIWDILSPFYQFLLVVDNVEYDMGFDNQTTLFFGDTATHYWSVNVYETNGVFLKFMYSFIPERLTLQSKPNLPNCSQHKHFNCHSIRILDTCGHPLIMGLWRQS